MELISGVSTRTGNPPRCRANRRRETWSVLLVIACVGCGESTAQLIYRASSDVPDAGEVMSAYGVPIGFATVQSEDVSTTTGGGALRPDFVTTCTELKRLLEDDQPRVIVVDGSIDCHLATPQPVTVCVRACDAQTGDSRNMYRVLLPEATDCSAISGWSASDPTEQRARNETLINLSSNKTLLGRDANAAIFGATLYIRNQSNVIVQNIAFADVNPTLVEAGDAITIQASHHVWVDHCSFARISDGFVDAIDGSQSITISWNRFDGDNPDACGQRHNYATTFEGASVTLHHNFYNRTLGCSPKLGAGSRGHLFDNYWLDVLYYAIQVGSESQAIVQSNYFEDSKQPYYASDSCFADSTPCGISAPEGEPNTFTGISADETHETGGVVDPLPYDPETYLIEPASDAKQATLERCGNTLTP